MLSRSPKLPLFLFLLLVAWLTMANKECVAPEETTTEQLQADEDPRLQGALRSAMANLATHDVRNAHRDFSFALGLDAHHAQAIQGVAITRLLLLPESAPVAELLRDLGAGPWLAQESLYGPQGLLKSLTQVSDEQEREASLYDALPWTREHWEEPALILDGVDPALTGDDLARHLEALAWELDDIADALHGSLDEPTFAPFVMPSTTFHGQTRWTLGSPELLTLEGGLRLASTALLWVSSYDWPHTLADYGSDATVQERIDGLHAYALRSVRPQNNLTLARGQLGRGLDNLRQALDSVPNSEPGSMGLQQLSAAMRRDLRDLLVALRVSVDEPMMLPDTEPQAHLYLGALFEERTLADEHGLLRYFPSEQGRQDDPEEAGRDRGDSVDEAEGELSPDYDGIRQLFLRGVLTPDCDLNPRAEDDCPRYKASQGGLGDMARELLEPLAGSLESDYAP